ncbi:flavodoxin [uncultured Clostridium sp.]|uniref:flavodoxin n=1 Tax=uncultured Clostridium sp. TaxID=59620 RepID=UPI0025E30844|nr:flavodoxin [uncultured Clostridium sp.]
MKIIYWTGTGNTEKMAKLIGEGIKEKGVDVEILNVSMDTINSDTIKDDSCIALGCPSMGNEELEIGEFVPMLDSIREELKDKKIALFGSYGWGDGEWMRSWEEEMKSEGNEIILEPLIVNYEPEGENVENCIEYGRKIAEIIK